MHIEQVIKTQNDKARKLQYGENDDDEGIAIDSYE